MKIRNRWTNEIIFENDSPTMRETVLAAIAADANLAGANLTGADLARADLTDANLTDADLTRADLTGANLTGADLARADLTDANLAGANLTGADLTAIRANFLEVLDAAPAEVEGLLSTLRLGQIDGTAYTGTCACLKGTIANLRKCTIGDLEDVSPILGQRPGSPSERWFLALLPGLTPANNQVAQITEGWIVEWQKLHDRPLIPIAEALGCEVPEILQAIEALKAARCHH